ncbi:Imm52 family immunity protein [Mycobacterium kansasii]
MYWGPRAESVDESAYRIARLVTTLAALDPVLSGWRDGGPSKREALAQPLVTNDHADLVERLLAGRNRRPDNNEVIEPYGYAAHWWNGGSDNSRPAAKLSIRIAGTSAIGLNNAMLDLPDQESAPRLYRLETARHIIQTLLDVFGPEWGVWTNNDLRNKQKEPNRPTKDGRGYVLGKLIGHPAGWANFLSDSDSVKFDMALLPAGATVERLGTGTLVLLGQDPADPPLRDVLQVRRAMGYEVPTQRTESSEDVDAASAGPAATPTAPGASVNPTDRGQSDPRPGIETRGVGYPESNTDAQRSDAQRGTSAHDK